MNGTGTIVRQWVHGVKVWRKGVEPSFTEDALNVSQGDRVFPVVMW